MAAPQRRALPERGALVESLPGMLTLGWAAVAFLAASGAGALQVGGLVAAGLFAGWLTARTSTLVLVVMAFALDASLWPARSLSGAAEVDMLLGVACGLALRALAGPLLRRRRLGRRRGRLKRVPVAWR